jgi:hypothetical protein
VQREIPSDHYWRPLCQPCDIKLVALLLSFLQHPRSEELSLAYARKFGYEVKEFGIFDGKLFQTIQPQEMDMTVEFASFTKKEQVVVDAIVQRALKLYDVLAAEQMRRRREDEAHVEMNLSAVHSHTPLRLELLRDFDDFNFAHDILGIERHLDKSTGELKDHFRPRCAKPVAQTRRPYSVRAIDRVTWEKWKVHRGNITATAREMGVTERTVAQRLARHKKRSGK